MLEKAFDKYAYQFDLSDPNLLSRYNHSYRVMKLCIKYAKNLNWSDEEVEIAKIIGLLHDFGRFKQYQKYHSFSDKDTVDHADYSAEQLFNQNEIVKFTDKEKYYDIIKFAIKNHNKLSIPECQDKTKLKFAKLIRDADKVDIMYVLGDSGEINQKGTDDIITKEVIECIKNHQSIPLYLIYNKNDQLALNFAFAFDLNNYIVLKDFKKNLKGFYDRVEHNNIFKEIYEITLEYIDERIQKMNKGEI